MKNSQKSKRLCPASDVAQKAPKTQHSAPHNLSCSVDVQKYLDRCGGLRVVWIRRRRREGFEDGCRTLVCDFRRGRRRCSYRPVGHRKLLKPSAMQSFMFRVVGLWGGGGVGVGLVGFSGEGSGSNGLSHHTPHGLDGRSVAERSAILSRAFLHGKQSPPPPTGMS